MKIVSVSIALFMFFMSLQVEAQQVMLQSVSPIHIQTFEIFDTGQYGFGIGQYRSGLPNCEDPGIPETCSMNGVFEIDLTTFQGSVRALFRFKGPAYDMDNLAIEGTEDDVVTITLQIDPVPQTELGVVYDLIITQIDVEGSSLHFINGFEFDIPSTSLSDGQRIGTLDADGVNLEGQLGIYSPDPIMGSILETFFGGEISYVAVAEEIDQPVVVPEPKVWIGILAGFAGLGIMHVIFRRKKSN